MSDNLTKRLIGGLVLVIALLPTFFVLDANITRVALVVCGLLAVYECAYYDYSIYSLIAISCGATITTIASRPILGLIILSSFGYDVFAYFGGKLLGGRLIKTRPFPKTSPNKSWEGLVIGLIVSIAVCFLFRHFYLAEFPKLPIIELSGGIIAAAGDYLNSRDKRTIGIKDSGTRFTGPLLPGHGGFVDRFASLFFVAATAGLLSALL